MKFRGNQDIDDKGFVAGEHWGNWAFSYSRWSLEGGSKHTWSLPGFYYTKQYLKDSKSLDYEAFKIYFLDLGCVYTPAIPMYAWAFRDHIAEGFLGLIKCMIHSWWLAGARNEDK